MKTQGLSAVILAGGKGKRLRPYTKKTPKPLLPIAGKPILAYTIEHLRQQGITDITLSTYYLRDQIEAYFGDGGDYSVSISYAVDDPPMGTAGAVAKLLDRVSDPFVVLPGDVLSDIDVSKLVELHEERKAAATICLFEMRSPTDFGIIRYDEDCRITAFEEKPIIKQIINTGVYVLDKGIFADIPRDRPVDFSYDLFPALLREGKPLYCHVWDGYWWDIGRVHDYEIASQIGNVLSLGR